MLLLLRPLRYFSELAKPLVLAMLLLILGAMPLWSQNNEPSLNDSENTSTTWNELYKQGQIIYETQKSDLEALKKEISSLRTGYNALTNLSERLSQSNEDLNRYNSQIAERMQERDEDLAWAYDEIDANKIEIAKKDKKIAEQVTQIVILYVILGVIVIGIIAITIIKVYIKMKLPIRL